MRQVCQRILRTVCVIQRVLTRCRRSKEISNHVALSLLFFSKITYEKKMVMVPIHYLPSLPLGPSLGGSRHSAFTTVRGITTRRHFNAPRLVAALGDEDSDAPLGGRSSTWRPESPTMATRPEENNDAAATVLQAKAAVGVIKRSPAAVERHRVKATNPNARRAALPTRVHRIAILLPGSLPGKRHRRTTARRVPLEFSISGGNGGSRLSRGSGSVAVVFAPTLPPLVASFEAAPTASLRKVVLCPVLDDQKL